MLDTYRRYVKVGAIKYRRYGSSRLGLLVTSTNDSAKRHGRRTQRDRSKTTRGELLAAARELFARDGFGATSLDAVVSSCAVTKGALYHHFDGKSDLFRAVFDEEQRRLADVVAAAYTRKADPWSGFLAGCRAFLGEALDPAVQQIVFLDAPGVLGWEVMRQIESDYGLTLLKDGLSRLIAAGRIRRRPVDPLAHLLFGSLTEAALFVARSTDREAARRQVVGEFEGLLTTLVDSA
jgi:AcrR family transcriptional regulator